MITHLKIHNNKKYIVKVQQELQRHYKCHYKNKWQNKLILMKLKGFINLKNINKIIKRNM
jgi:hypothetical protein